MYFDSLYALLTMDGHGFYVWTAYLVTLIVVAMTLISPLRRRKRFLQHLAAELKRNQVAPGGGASGGP
jgi:heme exporter protein D